MNNISNRVAALLLTLLASAAAANPPPVDYFNADFEIVRVLDWGDRPDWSPDGQKIAFVESDKTESYVFELEIATGKVRCLTCQWGPESGYFSRVYYLPDGSFLLTGGTPFAEMYWLPASLASAPQALNIDGVFGEIAIYRKALANGNLLLSWGFVSAEGHLQLMTGELAPRSAEATLADRKVVYDYDPANPGDSGITLAEAYSFTREGRGLLFATMESATLTTQMYELDLPTGALNNVSRSSWHSETHLFDGLRIGIEESNRVSDPNGPLRGISVHPPFIIHELLKALALELPAGVTLDTGEGSDKYAHAAFELFVVDIDQPERLRRLTHVSDIGGEVDQKVLAPDGRRIAFTLAAPSQGPLVGKDGLYIGEFR